MHSLRSFRLRSLHSFLLGYAGDTNPAWLGGRECLDPGVRSTSKLFGISKRVVQFTGSCSNAAGKTKGSLKTLCEEPLKCAVSQKFQAKERLDDLSQL
jgi:hypothetical protein